MVYISMLVSLSIVLHTVEAMIPLPSPWIKLGLANSISLIAIVLLGIKEALIVTLLRVIVGSLIFGTLLSPAFLLGLSGGIISTLTMGVSYKGLCRHFSLIGISIIGSYTHTITVMVVVYLLFIKHIGLFSLLPVFLFFALITGTLNGIVANLLNDRLKREGITTIE